MKRRGYASHLKHVKRARVASSVGDVRGSVAEGVGDQLARMSKEQLLPLLLLGTAGELCASLPEKVWRRLTTSFGRQATPEEKDLLLRAHGKTTPTTFVQLRIATKDRRLLMVPDLQQPLTLGVARLLLDCERRRLMLAMRKEGTVWYQLLSPEARSAARQKRVENYAQKDAALRDITTFFELQIAIPVVCDRLRNVAWNTEEFVGLEFLPTTLNKTAVIGARSSSLYSLCWHQEQAAQEARWSTGRKGFQLPQRHKRLSLWLDLRLGSTFAAMVTELSPRIGDALLRIVAQYLCCTT